MRQKTILCILGLLVLWLAGCQGPPAQPTPTSTPDMLPERLAQAEAHSKSLEFEDAAIAYREVLDEMERRHTDEARQAEVRELCTKMLVEAGGYNSSRKLWFEMGEKNPDSKMEAARMVKRAEKFMRMQAGELLVQSQADFKEGRRSKALSTAQAAESLLQNAHGSEEQMTTVRQLIEQYSLTPEVKVSPSPS
jgi:hypothetical protein